MAPTLKLRCVNIICISILLALMGCMDELGDEGFSTSYAEYCASCHGENLEGTGIGPALMGRDLKHGETIESLRLSIQKGFPEAGMPAWTGNLDDGVVQGLAIYIADVRAGRAEYFDFQVVDEELLVPERTIRSEVLDFRLEVVSNEIHKHPFSIAPMRDGNILVTEKTRGLRIVRPDGSISERNYEQTGAWSYTPRKMGG